MIVSFKLDGENLDQCHQYNYLGVVLDETMTMEPNYNCIFKNFSFKIFKLSQICGIFYSKTRILIYKQRILPLVEYVIYLLYLNRKTDVAKLQRLQNRALPIYHGIHNPRAITTANLHAQSKLLKLSERRELVLMNIYFDLRDDVSYIDPALANTRQAQRITFKTELVR